jgi:hypothetical protein
MSFMACVWPRRPLFSFQELRVSGWIEVEEKARTEMIRNVDEKAETFLVVHPLDNAPQQKLDTNHLEPMRMTRSVRYSLFALGATRR